MDRSKVDKKKLVKQLLEKSKVDVESKYMTFASMDYCEVDDALRALVKSDEFLISTPNEILECILLAAKENAIDRVLGEDAERKFMRRRRCERNCPEEELYPAP